MFFKSNPRQGSGRAAARLKKISFWKRAVICLPGTERQFKNCARVTFCNINFVFNNIRLKKIHNILFLCRDSFSDTEGLSLNMADWSREALKSNSQHYYWEFHVRLAKSFYQEIYWRYSLGQMACNWQMLLSWCFGITTFANPHSNPTRQMVPVQMHFEIYI